MARPPMTADEFTARLPRLTNNPLPIQPPFVFNGMSSRVFPLRAHLGTLQRLVDGYMNFVPPQAGYFRVPVPYVFVMLLDYGQVAEAVTRIGWFAQTEVFFLIPLEWYKFVNGKWVFHDWAVITPYVFVNDEFSVPLGRTVFGFPKVLARIANTPSEWIKDATGPITLARVDTAVFPETYSGTQIQNRPLLEIERNTISNMQIPFVSSSPVMPWEIATHLAKAAAGFGRDALWLAQSMRLSPTNPISDPGAIQAMLSRMAPWLAPGGEGFVQNSINLKQFRRSEKPSEFCYQALTNGQMVTKAFNGAGLLGEYPIMFGDLSGGHNVRLYEYASLPLVKTLGLEVDRQWHNGSCVVNEMKPVVPFWLDVDIQYNQGDNIAWRTADQVWRDGTGAPFDPQPAPSAANAPDFNQTVTTPVDDIAGPFDFAGSTVRVLPLLAKREKLTEFLDGYINKPLQGRIVHEKDKNIEEHIRFTIWSRGSKTDGGGVPEVEDLAYVYLMISSFGDVISTTNNVGDWTDYQLSFMIPVHFERKNEAGEWELAGVGLVPAFSFVDNCIAAIARFEVQGFETVVGTFDRPSSEWLSDTVALGDNPPQTLLNLKTEVWPAIGTGQKAVIQPLIEILQGDPCAGLGNAPNAPWNWSSTLRAELQAKKSTKATDARDLKIARALSMELLGNQMPFAAYTLKQFRDARDPSRACYQSLVRVPRQIKELDDLREIEETLVVRIHDYPSLDIAGQLGLVVHQEDEAGCGVISTAQAVRPFFLTGTLHEPLAERLAYRAGDDDWLISPGVAFRTLLSEEPGAPKITADYTAEKLQDQMDPCRISNIMHQAAMGWRAEQDDSVLSYQPERNADRFTKEDARKALAMVDPQTVIESILAREWANADPDARWRTGRQELIKAFTALPLDGEMSAYIESVLYARINNSLAAAPGSVAGELTIVGENISDVDDQRKILSLIKSDDTWYSETEGGRWAMTLACIIHSQSEFTSARLKMENAFTILSSAAILSPDGVRTAYAQLGRAEFKEENLAEKVLELFQALSEISRLRIEGEPSERNNLDTHVFADEQRLKDLLVRFGGMMPQANSTDPKRKAIPMKWAVSHVAEVKEMVDLARCYCAAQYEALLNKLSRAYQKPDFCIKRDSVPGAEELLPLALSWDKDWYYGRNVMDEMKVIVAQSQRAMEKKSKRDAMAEAASSSTGAIPARKRPSTRKQSSRGAKA